MVQIGFEPKIAFLCPLCNKEVGMVYERGKESWTSEHSGCLNYSVIREVPAAFGRCMEAPLVFISLESDFSVKEAVEGLRRLCKDEAEQSKRLKLESGMKRLESKLGFAEKNLPQVMDAVRGGSFGVKVVSGRDVYALLWKSGDKYLGMGDERCREKANTNMFLASTSLEESQKFVNYWLHYWEVASQSP